MRPVQTRDSVSHIVTTRRGPDTVEIRDNPATAARQIAAALGAHDVAFVKQIHGGDARICTQGGLVGPADGLATSVKGLALLGKSADCPIVMIAERRGRAVGFAHASWRATVASVVPAVVGRMVDLGCKTSDLVACIGPSAGPECYEVGEEVRDAALRGIGPHAAAFFRPGPSGKAHFDLWQANIDALVWTGVPPEAIHIAGLCTICHNDLFPSYRRDGKAAGRFAVALALPSHGKISVGRVASLI
jgi:YfiH family protein